jgi:hypothetical protein
LADSYSIAGVWLITCAFALIIIPLLVIFKGYNKETLEQIEKINETRNHNAGGYVGHI